MDAIPEQMRKAPRWLVWKSEPNSDPTKKPRKVPYYVDGTRRSGRLDSPADLSRLATYDAAVNAVLCGYSGLGFALGPDGTGNAWQGADLDDVESHPEAASVASTLPGYVETSPSKKGLHAVGYGRPFDSLGSNGTGIEAYSAGRYFTVTGQRVNGSEIICIADLVENTLRPIHRGQPKPEPPSDPITPQTIEDLRSALGALDSDDRDLWVRMGLALRTLGDDGYDLWEEWSQSGVKWDPHNDPETWKSFKPDRTGYKAVFAEAKRQGWVNPAAAPPPGELFADVKIYKLSFRRHTREELTAARLTPREIVRDLLYADVRTMNGPGGVSKTTLELYATVTLGLGKPLWGRPVASPVRSVIVTREDPAAVLLGRLREICNAMLLSDEEIETVLDHVRILDLSGEPFRLTEIDRDIVKPNLQSINWLIDTLNDFKPDWLIFDPLISFGTGEARVNDSEQGLIEAFRILRNRLDCCVEAIHHVGKQNAREKTLDQYAGRGGSALADGSRMVAVIAPRSPAEWEKVTGEPLGEHEAGLEMALPKLSYTRPQNSIFIKRIGYSFIQVATTQSTEDRRARNCKKLGAFINAEYAAGRHYSKRELEQFISEIGLSRDELRKAAIDLTRDSDFVYHDLGHRGGSYFEPVGCADPSGATGGEK